jgi:very-short-patch-repair endonuclease
MYKYNNKLTQYARKNRNARNLPKTLLWNQLKRNNLGVRFTKQKPIGNYIADFYCPEKHFVIEIDGSSHDYDYKYDTKRDEYMQSLGIFVLRISDKDVKYDMENTLVWIKQNLDKIK